MCLKVGQTDRQKAGGKADRQTDRQLGMQEVGKCMPPQFCHLQRTGEAALRWGDVTHLEMEFVTHFPNSCNLLDTFLDGWFLLDTRF